MIASDWECPDSKRSNEETLAESHALAEFLSNVKAAPLIHQTIAALIPKSGYSVMVYGLSYSGHYGGYPNRRWNGDRAKHLDEELRECAKVAVDNLETITGIYNACFPQPFSNLTEVQRRNGFTQFREQMREQFSYFPHSPPANFYLPEELPSEATYSEGSVQRIEVNRYERDPKAREACIQHYGYTCAICDFNFRSIYGLPVDYIHIHHLKPLSEIGAEYLVDPINDLRPVCPNCHAVLHLGGVTRTLEEVKQMLVRNMSTL